MYTTTEVRSRSISDVANALRFSYLIFTSFFAFAPVFAVLKLEDLPALSEVSFVVDGIINLVLLSNV